MSTPPEDLPAVNTYDRDVMPVREEPTEPEPKVDEAKAEQPTKRTAHRK